MKSLKSLSEWRAVVLKFCEEVNAELLFINESDFSFGVDYGNCIFQHIYPDELYEYYKQKEVKA